MLHAPCAAAGEVVRAEVVARDVERAGDEAEGDEDRVVQEEDREGRAVCGEVDRFGHAVRPGEAQVREAREEEQEKGARAGPVESVVHPHDEGAAHGDGRGPAKAVGRLVRVDGFLRHDVRRGEGQHDEDDELEVRRVEVERDVRAEGRAAEGAEHAPRRGPPLDPAPAGKFPRGERGAHAGAHFIGAQHVVHGEAAHEVRREGDEAPAAGYGVHKTRQKDQRADDEELRPGDIHDVPPGGVSSSLFLMTEVDGCDEGVQIPLRREARRFRDEIGERVGEGLAAVVAGDEHHRAVAVPVFIHVAPPVEGHDEPFRGEDDPRARGVHDEIDVSRTAHGLHVFQGDFELRARAAHHLVGPAGDGVLHGLVEHRVFIEEGPVHRGEARQLFFGLAVAEIGREKRRLGAARFRGDDVSRKIGAVLPEAGDELARRVGDGAAHELHGLRARQLPVRHPGRQGGLRRLCQIRRARGQAGRRKGQRERDAFLFHSSSLRSPYRA